MAPSRPGRSATEMDCAGARKRLKRLFDMLGLRRHPEKGVWEGSRRLEHLGVWSNKECMRVYVADRKVKRVRKFASRILLLAQLNKRLVSVELVRRFCGICVSLLLGYPLARFYTRSLYFDLSIDGEQRVRATKWGVRVL